MRGKQWLFVIILTGVMMAWTGIRLFSVAAAQPVEAASESETPSLAALTGNPLIPTAQAPSTTALIPGAATDSNSVTGKVSSDQIEDGTAPFDSDDTPGHDSSAHNNRVRTFDAIKVPVYYNINTTVANPETMTVRVDGEIDGGFSQGRIVAFVPPYDQSDQTTDKYAMDNVNNRSTFSQVRTVTHLSGVIYVTIFTIDGHNNDQFTPHFNLTLTSVNGTAVTTAPTTAVTGFPTYTVSATPSVSVSGNFTLPDNVDTKAPITIYEQDAVSLRAIAHGTTTSIMGTTFPDSNQVTFVVGRKGNIDMKNNGDPQLGGDPVEGAYFTRTQAPDQHSTSYPYGVTSSVNSNGQTLTFTMGDQSNTRPGWSINDVYVSNIAQEHANTIWSYSNPYKLGGSMNTQSLENTVDIAPTTTLGANTDPASVKIFPGRDVDIQNFKPTPPAAPNGSYYLYAGYSNPNDAPTGQTPLVAGFLNTHAPIYVPVIVIPYFTPPFRTCRCILQRLSPVLRRMRAI